MIVQLNAPEPTDRDCNRTERQGGSPPQVIDFFAARYRMLSESKSSIGSIGFCHRDNEKKIFLSRELSHPIYDPIEDWLNSLISAAALASLLIGILCLPNMTTNKTAHSQPRPISDQESIFVTQKPS